MFCLIRHSDRLEDGCALLLEVGVVVGLSRETRGVNDVCSDFVHGRVEPRVVQVHLGHVAWVSAHLPYARDDVFSTVVRLCSFTGEWTEKMWNPDRDVVCGTAASVQLPTDVEGWMGSQDFPSTKSNVMSFYFEVSVTNRSLRRTRAS